LTNTPAGTNSIITGTDHPFVFDTISDLTANKHIIDLKPPASLAFTGNSVAGATWGAGYPFTNTPLRTSSIVTGTDHPFVFNTISDLTANDHVIGLQPPAGLVFTGDAAVAPKWDSVTLTFTNTPVGTSPIVTGADHPFVFNTISDLIAGDHIIGPQPPAGLVFTGDAAAGATPRSSFPFTNTPVGSSSIITGTDHVSLSKILSDITSSGDIITGWTVTYLAAEPR
jgi:hypothetical protein